MKEIELRPRVADKSGDELYISRRGDRVTFSPQIDGCGNDFCMSVEQLIRKLGGK